MKRFELFLLFFGTGYHPLLGKTRSLTVKILRNFQGLLAELAKKNRPISVPQY